MSTQPSSTIPPISLHFQPYVDTKRAAEFLSVGLKRLQKLSREGKIPAHPEWATQSAEDVALQAQRA